MDAVSFTKDWIKSDQAEQDIAEECVETHHRDKYHALDSAVATENNSTCKNPRIREILADQTTLEKEELYSKGAALGSSDDATLWSAGRFEQPAPIGLEPEPLLNIFTSSKLINEKRILGSDGREIDVVGIFSWFSPRYSLLTDRCRALENYRISPDFSSCVRCGPGTGPTEDRRECKPCEQLVGHRYSQDGGSCVRCPPGEWPSSTSPSECLACHLVEGVRYSEDRSTCVRCEADTTPSADSTQCLDCSLPDHALNPKTKRCFKCSPGSWRSTWPNTEGSKCSPCELLNGVRYSDDRTTCVQCPHSFTPNEDSTACLPCSDWNNFYTSPNKTRCAVCPGGQKARDDQLSCYSIDGKYESWESWGSCSISCLETGGELGVKYRRRRCTRPLYGGKECDPAGKEESEPCAGNGTGITLCPVDGTWQRWNNWTACSVTCGGGGTRTRTRFCNEPQHGGKYCEGVNLQQEPCTNSKPCPVDGYWSDYTGWGTCSKTCGGGTMTRTRICTPPLHDGAECVGSAVDTSDCSMQPCLPPGVWLGEWTPWGGCVWIRKVFGPPCGQGRRTRTRVCIEPPGGRWCQPSVTTASQDCNVSCDRFFDFSYLDQIRDG